MTKIHQIRKEFGEPFRDVVAGFALMGFSQTLTAGACGVARSTLQHHIKRLGMSKLFRKQADMLPQCRGGNKKGNPGPRPPIYPDETLFSILREYGLGISRSQFDNRQGGHPSSSLYIKRFGSWTNAKKLAAEGGHGNN